MTGTTAWLLGAVALVVALFPLAARLLRGTPFDQLIFLEVASVLQVLVLLALAEGLDRDVYFDLAVVAAPLSFAGNLAYARFLEGGP